MQQTVGFWKATGDLVINKVNVKDFFNLLKNKISLLP